MKAFLGTLAIVVIALLASLLVWRGPELLSCTIAQSDLGRPTSFSFLSGKCMITNKNGERVYLNQVRTMSNDADDQNQDDGQ